LVPEKFLTFACTGQGGHTIIAAILDAHPNVMIGEEIGVIRKTLKGRYKSTQEMFERVFYDSKHRVEGTESFRRRIGTIRSQFQGTYVGELKVLGDKQGWDIIGRFKNREQKNKSMLDFEEKIGVPAYVIHVLRNPFDLIGNWAKGKFRRLSIKKCIEIYEPFMEAVQKIYYESDFPKDRILQVRNEDLCEDPVREIKRMCTFLEIEPHEDYVRDCAKIVFKKPHTYPDKRRWKSADIERLNNIISQYDFLKGYEHK
jgi:hypothetical protein